MAQRIKVAVDGHIARVTLNRPDKHNAVDRAMFDAFIETGRALAADASIRVVILGGEGDNFCAGIDVATFTGGGVDPSLMRPAGTSPANYFQSAAYVWRQMRVPVIAALKGYVFGAGLQIALGADLRIAAPEARMSIMEVKWGLVPDMAFSTTLPAVLPYDKAAELAWSGRIVDAIEAHDIGLVTELADDPFARAEELAGRIAGQSPDAVRAIKTLLQAAYEERDAALLKLEAELQMRVMAAPNQREAVTANLEKRAPRFEDSDL